MRISDWSSDVCSSDLEPMPQRGKLPLCGRSQLHRRTRRAGDDQMVWLFDLDNTLHDSSRAIFKAIDRSMTTAVASTLNIDLDAASRIRTAYWRRYGATEIGRAHV